MQSIDNIIFDWDGTLVKTPEVIAKSYKEVLFREGYMLTDAHFKRFMMGNWVNGLGRYGIANAEAIVDKVMSVFSNKLEDVELYPGVTSTLQKLQNKHKKMALLTTTPREYLDKTKVSKTILKYFNCILTEDEIGSNKLNLFVLETCLRQLKSKKENTVFIGNTKKDAVIGKEFGIITIIYYPRENERYYFKNDILSHKSDYVIRNFSELLKIIK